MSFCCLLSPRSKMRNLVLDADLEYEEVKPRTAATRCLGYERSWSENFIRSRYEKMRSNSGLSTEKKARKGHRRLNTTGAVAFEGMNSEPRLLRCGGMRRDWSFVDRSKTKEGSA
uniref:Uncharacterized protein n=1 Tax=Nelumbo nucifera TaxID=4432 RepID=A0A822ZNB9_NELNU|nr:TPA_asm: hypothetical protein HUJ06_017431 [Nelumbo nucifera]